MITIIIRAGAVSARVATSAPGMPATLYPAKVAMLMPTGPGVLSLIATMLARSLAVYQLYFVVRSIRNGRVAMPPPMENRPILKNSNASVR